jgi:hypothetical protein
MAMTVVGVGVIVGVIVVVVVVVVVAVVAVVGDVDKDNVSVVKFFNGSNNVMINTLHYTMEWFIGGGYCYCCCC